MMPAISLSPLPPLPPFQFMPEPELNFEVVLEAVPTLASPMPAQTERALPGETLLSFLGINPVKAQPIAPESLAIEEETLDDEVLIPETLLQLAASGLLPKPSFPFNLQEEESALTATRREPMRTALDATDSPEVSSTPPPQPFRLAPGGSLSKPRLSLNLEEKDSSSTSSVRTELGVSTLPQIFKDAVTPTPLNPSGLGDTINTFPQPITATPPADPLRFVVERQLDLARDSRWLDALARDIVAVAETPERLSFRLSPPQLGRLDVDLNASENGLSVRMNASSEAATQIIAAAQPRLIDELKNQGVRVAEAQVSTSSGGQSQSQSHQQQRDADQMIEYARARFERTNETSLTRPTGRFA